MLIVFLGLIVNSYAESETTNENEEVPVLTLNKVEDFYSEFSELPHENKNKPTIPFRKLQSKIEDSKDSSNNNPVSNKVSNNNKLVVEGSKEKTDMKLPSNQAKKLSENSSTSSAEVLQEKKSNVDADKKLGLAAEIEIKSETNQIKVEEKSKNLKIEKPNNKPEQNLNLNQVNIPIQASKPVEKKEKENKLKVVEKDQVKANPELEEGVEAVLSFESENNNSNDKSQDKTLNRKSNLSKAKDAVDPDKAKYDEILAKAEPVEFVKELSDTGAASMRDDR